VAQLASVPQAQTAPVPPQNLEAEESVLGAMLLSPGAIGAVSEFLDAGDFYREGHARMYRAALALYAKGEPVDAITLVDELEQRGEVEAVGGRVRVHELAALVPATANAAHYARIVKEMATLRNLIEAGGEIARLGWERPGETADLVDRAEQVVFDLSQRRVTGDFAHIEALLKESFERITLLYEAGAEVTGTPSGFRELDRLTSGFQPGNLVIIAARPSMGKSALGLCMAANLGVRYEMPVALFTLEMSKAEVTQRLMCSEAKVESQRLRTGKLAVDDWPRLTAACDKLAKAPIYVDDTGSITMMELRSKSRRLKAKEPSLALIVVDYLQLMTSGVSAENRVQEVSQISRQLKVLARDLELPILAMSQLSRAVEQRHDKRPILSDLRESGCVPGDTRVYLPDAGTYRPIRELIGRRGFRVLAVDAGSDRLAARQVTRAFATGQRPVLRLTTRLGRTVRATGNHKFLAFDGWRRLDDLAPGMRLAVPRRLIGPAGQTLSDAELALLGHLLVEGRALTRTTVRYRSSNRNAAHLVARLAASLCGASLRAHVTREGDRWRTDLAAGRRFRVRGRNPVATWLEELGVIPGRRSQRRVPEPVLVQPWEAVGLFLRHLWSTAGTISALPNGGATIRFETASEGLATDVGSLLLRLGVVSRASSPAPRGGRRLHRLDVEGPADTHRFLTLVGGLGERQERECADIHAALAGRVRSLAPAVLASGAGAGTGREGRAAGLERDRARLRAGIAAAEEINATAAGDLYWDEIVAIEPAGVEDVYDLTVEGLHSFVAEDVVLHNSIEQDADVVAFVYRDEYYNDESDQQGLAEVIVAKHRNGPTDAIKLSFLKRYAKFADLAQ
jgi:replicative DNA helicase